jgi:hypothetical protein
VLGYATATFCTHARTHAQCSLFPVKPNPVSLQSFSAREIRANLLQAIEISYNRLHEEYREGKSGPRRFCYKAEADCIARKGSGQLQKCLCRIHCRILSQEQVPLLCYNEMVFIMSLRQVTCLSVCATATHSYFWTNEHIFIKLWIAQSV